MCFRILVQNDEQQTYSSKIPKLKERSKKLFGHLGKTVVYDI